MFDRKAVARAFGVCQRRRFAPAKLKILRARKRANVNRTCSIYYNRTKSAKKALFYVLLFL
jgi:hypothetical protein